MAPPGLGSWGVGDAYEGMRPEQRTAGSPPWTRAPWEAGGGWKGLQCLNVCSYHCSVSCGEGEEPPQLNLDEFAKPTRRVGLDPRAAAGLLHILPLILPFGKNTLLCPPIPEIKDYNCSLAAQWQRICLQCRSRRRHRLDPWVGNIPWRRKRPPTPVLLPGESHGQRALRGYSPWGHTESDTT